MSKSGKFIALAASAVLLSVLALGPLGARAEERGSSKTAGYPVLVSVREEVESYESFVIQERWPDSGGAADVDE